MRPKLIPDFIADLKPVLPYTVWWLLHFPSSLFSNLRSFFIAVKQTNPKAGGLALWQLVMNLVKFPVHFLLTSVSLCLNAIASLLNNLLAHSLLANGLLANSSERGLSEPEIHFLKNIFADNLDYTVIRIQTGGIKERLRISPQAVGNDIFLRKFWGSPIVESNGSLSHAGLCLLGHEACHVWQFQTGGAAYIGDSLITQALDFISRRFGWTLTDGYNVVAALKAGTAFEHCNVEQQAVMAETIGAACFVSGLESPQKNELSRFLDTSLSNTEYLSVLRAHQIFKGSE